MENASDNSIQGIRDGKTVATVQVRMGSTRYPGKVLHEVCGRPLLGYLTKRLEQCKTIDQIVVATSTRAENDAIERFCRQSNIDCFRGSEEDVLGRMLGALEGRSARYGVEVYGDGPLIDPSIVDSTVSYFKQHPEYDFVGNDLHTSFPPGMEVEVFSVAALKDSARRTSKLETREHGTLFLRTHPELYRLKNLVAPSDLRRPDLELEVDTSEDIELISFVIEQFDGRLDFSLEEIIALLDSNEKMRSINNHVVRRWKEYRKS